RISSEGSRSGQQPPRRHPRRDSEGDWNSEGRYAPDDDHGQRDPDPETCKLKHQEKEGIAPLGPTRLAYCIRAGPTSLAHSLDVQNVVANLVLLSPNALAGCKSWGIVHE